MLFWFAFTLWLRILIISPYIHWSTACSIYFAHLLIELFVILVFNFLAHYIFWILIPYQMNGWQKFSPILWLFLDSGECLLWYAEVSNLMQSHLSILAYFWSYESLTQKMLPIPDSSHVSPMLFCSNFKVSGLTLRSLIHFLIFVAIVL
jgi:hypothetical protein